MLIDDLTESIKSLVQYLFGMERPTLKRSLDSGSIPLIEHRWIELAVLATCAFWQLAIHV